ncbi:hypothetical protein GCM10023080_029970 [Streptomyces pseudoechinosporeus]
MCVVVAHTPHDLAPAPSRMIGTDVNRETVHTFERDAIVQVHLGVIFQHLSKCAPFMHSGPG